MKIDHIKFILMRFLNEIMRIIYDSSIQDISNKTYLASVGKSVRTAIIELPL